MLPTPQPPHFSSDEAVDAELRRLYTMHAPGKLSVLPQLKSKYGARLLLAKCEHKYEGGAAPVTPPTSPPDPGLSARSQEEMESKLAALLALGATRRTTTRAVRGRAALPLEDRPTDPLHQIICSGDTAALQALHEGDGPPVDLRQPWCRRHPALVIEVARRGHAEMLGYMVAAAAGEVTPGRGQSDEAAAVDLEVLTSTGRTLLMVAVHTGHYAVVKVLLGSRLCTNIDVRSGFDLITALLANVATLPVCCTLRHC